LGDDMKIEIKKNGRFADSAPHMPQVTVKAGEVRDDLSDYVASAVIRTGCGVEVAEKKPDVDTEDILKQLADEAETTAEAKKALEAWGKENAGIDVNRTKSVKNIIKDILAAING